MSKIRECFISRFPDGMLVEVDFSQLEVAALAFLTQDPQLMADIRDELDMHLVSASWVTGQDYKYLKRLYDSGDYMVAKIRKEAKRPRFELQYGAGASTIAKNNKWPLDKAKDYIARYYARYPIVLQWQMEVARQVQCNKKPRNKFGEEFISWYECPHTKRRYVFYTYENKRGEQHFSPTQMKNYPVQGFATGDLVPTVLGRIVKLMDKDMMEGIKLINTVHDSVLFDVHPKFALQLQELIDDTFGKTAEIMKDQFGIDINVPIRYSISTGPNWGQMKEV